MKEYVIHQHHHFGWTKEIVEAKTVNEAVTISVQKAHDFLEKEYKGKYSVENTIGLAPDHPRYRVTWTHDEPKLFFDGSVSKGEVWFADYIELGKLDDCDQCGGTGENHYNEWLQCWECGDGETRGKSSGKMSDDPSTKDEEEEC